MLEPGTVIGDKYRIERVIGRGGMGTVVEVTHAQLGTAFALKFLHRGVAGNSPVAERFFREARATAALRSEHVCRVFDVGSFEGQPYLVMERLEGTDLSKLLRRLKRLPVHDVCDYLIQACAGIAEAHAAQIVHRDLKPGNLFLTSRPDGTALIKVLDFGIAKAPQETDHDLTGTHAVLGSPSYMSLEQLRSSKLVDARSDIWSLGVILFELISGRRPFVGDGVADLAVKIALEPTPRLPDGPRELDDVIARCLAREPAQRYQNAAELALALAPYADDAERSLAVGLARSLSPVAGAPDVLAGRSSRPSTAGLGPPIRPGSQLPPEDPYGPATTMLSAGAIEPAPRPPRANRARIGLIGIVAVAIIGGASIGIAVTGGGGESPRALEQAGPASGPERPAGEPAGEKLDRPAGAPAPAPIEAAPAPTFPVEPTLPADAATPRASGEPVGEDARGKINPGEPEIEAAPPPVRQPPRTPPRRPLPPRRPPGNDDDLGKSRI